MRIAIVDSVTRALVGLDPPLDEDGQPMLPEGGTFEVIELSGVEAAKLSQPGSYTVSSNGTVAVTPPGPEAPSVVERSAALDDLQAQYDTAIARLDQIIGAANPTNPQVIAAVRDIATYFRKTLRLLHAQYTDGSS